MSNESPGGILKMLVKVNYIYFILFFLCTASIGHSRPHNNPVIVSPSPYSWISPFQSYVYSPSSQLTQAGYSQMPGAQHYFTPLYYYTTANFPLPVPRYIPSPVSNILNLQQPSHAPVLQKPQTNVLEVLSTLVETTDDKNSEEQETEDKGTKSVSTLPPPTAEEEEHLARFEEHYELLKLPENSEDVNPHEPHTFEQFSQSKPSKINEQVLLKNSPASLTTLDTSDGFDNTQASKNASSETSGESNFDIRLPKFASNKRNKIRRSSTDGTDKRMFAVITAVINHKRRQRQLQPNDLNSTENNADDDLPTLLENEEMELEKLSSMEISKQPVNERKILDGKEFKREVLKAEEDEAEIMAFSEDEKLEPIERFLSPGTPRSLAMMNFAGHLFNDVRRTGLEFTSSIPRPIASFDYEVSNDTFSGDIAKDLPPTIPNATNMREPISTLSGIASPPNLPQLGDEDEEISIQPTTTSAVLSSETDTAEIAYDSKNSDLPPLPSTDLYDDNAVGINDSPNIKLTDLPKESPKTEQILDPIPLPDINTSDLPPLPGSLFPDDPLKSIFDEIENANNIPGSIQVDDLVSADLPPLPDISLFPISTQNDLLPIPKTEEPKLPTKLEAPTTLKPILIDTEQTPRPSIFPGGNLPPIFPEPEEEPAQNMPIPTMPTSIRQPSQSTETSETLIPYPTQYENVRMNKELPTPSPHFSMSKETSPDSSRPSESIEESSFPVPQQSNDWIRDIAIKALDRGISVQNIYSINVGKIHVKSEGQSTSISDHPGFARNFIKNLEHSLNQAVDAVSKSVLKALSPTQQHPINEDKLVQSSGNSNSKKLTPPTTTGSKAVDAGIKAAIVPETERRPLQIDPRHISYREDSIQVRTPQSPLVPLDIDFRVLDKQNS